MSLDISLWLRPPDNNRRENGETQGIPEGDYTDEYREGSALAHTQKHYKNTNTIGAR
jgi:hypothetical protein